MNYLDQKHINRVNEYFYEVCAGQAGCQLGDWAAPLKYEKSNNTER